MSGRRVVFLFRDGPAQSERVREGIDAALAALAMDCTVDALFLGDGVDLLRRGQDGRDSLQKPRAASLGALPAHGASALAVDAAALARHGMTAADLLHAPRLLSTPEIAAILRGADAVIPV